MNDKKPEGLCLNLYGLPLMMAEGNPVILQGGGKGRTGVLSESDQNPSSSAEVQIMRGHIKITTTMIYAEVDEDMILGDTAGWQEKLDEKREAVMAAPF